MIHQIFQGLLNKIDTEGVSFFLVRRISNGLLQMDLGEWGRGTLSGAGHQRGGAMAGDKKTSPEFAYSAFWCPIRQTEDMDTKRSFMRTHVAQKRERRKHGNGAVLGMAAGRANVGFGSG